MRRSREAVTVLEDLRKFYDVGNTPGPFWTAIRHPVLNQEAGVWIYGDVCMLYHLVGASNDADLFSLHHLQQDMSTAEENSVNYTGQYRENQQKEQ